MSPGLARRVASLPASRRPLDVFDVMRAGLRSLMSFVGLIGEEEWLLRDGNVALTNGLSLHPESGHNLAVAVLGWLLTMTSFSRA